MKNRFSHSVIGMIAILGGFGCSASGDADMPTTFGVLGTAGTPPTGPAPTTNTTNVQVTPEAGGFNGNSHDPDETGTGTPTTPQGGIGSQDYNPPEAAGTAGTPPVTSTGGSGTSQDPPSTGGNATIDPPPPSTGGVGTSRDIVSNGGTSTCTHTGGTKATGGSATGGKNEGGSQDCGCPEGGTKTTGGTKATGGSATGGKNEGGSRDIGSGGVAGGSAGEAGSRDITGGEGGSQDIPPTGGTSSGGTASGGTSTGGTSTGGTGGSADLPPIPQEYKNYVTAIPSSATTTGMATACYDLRTGAPLGLQLCDGPGYCYYGLPDTTNTDWACGVVTGDSTTPWLPINNNGTCELGWGLRILIIASNGGHPNLSTDYWELREIDGTCYVIIKKGANTQNLGI